MNLPRNVMFYGAADDLPALCELRAGPLPAMLEGGDLRYIRFGKHELLRRVYAAVSDRHWMTIAPRYSNWDIQVDPQAFHVEFVADHVRDEINFHWHGKIVGTREGTIRYTMDGEVRRAFWRNRIGFCVLHPMNIAGAPARVEHTDGSVVTGAFPMQIAPQRILQGKEQPVAPFREMRALSHQVRDGVWARVVFTVDLFELEDQRDWTDASFESYCTPVLAGFVIPPILPAKTEHHSPQKLFLSCPPKASTPDFSPVYVHTSLLTFLPPQTADTRMALIWLS